MLHSHEIGLHDKYDEHGGCITMVEFQVLILLEKKIVKVNRVVIKEQNLVRT